MAYDKVYHLIAKELICIFGFHPSRIDCLCEFILCLIKARTTNLSKLSQVFCSDAQSGSRYRRLQRFVSEVSFDQEVLSKFLVSIVGFNKIVKWTLLIDRTNWRLGNIHVSVLHLSACHERSSVAVPLFWVFLRGKKQGNSGFNNQKKLLDMFIKTFGKERIKVILGDREFISQYWITYLQKLKIQYAMRVRDKAGFISNTRGKMVKPRKLFCHLQPGQTKQLGERRIAKTNNLKTNISASRNNKGELLVLMHSQELDDAITTYAKRWQIEVMFRCFKSGGFDMEATHVTDPGKIETITAVIAIAFCIAYKTGLWQAEHDLPPIKSHGRKAKSIFRIGLDKIQNALFNLKNKANEIIKILKEIFQNARKSTVTQLCHVH